ncbi:MAG: response regulator [Balneolales bacterium]
MIVEDEFILAQDIKNRLTALNYNVVGLCSNGDDALKKAQTLKPDLVLMDIRLEGDKDGIETADGIQKDMDIPVIFLSAYADKETVKRARISEPMGYLIKPVEEKELETTIEMALHKHQINRRIRENEQWLATTLENIGDAVIRTDADKRIVLLNSVAANLTGWSEEEAKGRNLDDVLKFIDEETAQPVHDPVSHSLEEDNPGSKQQFLLTSKTGAETPVDYSCTLIKGSQNELIGVVTVIHNITERRRSEQLIEHRLTLEKALDEVARLLLKNTSPHFTNILKMLGTAMEADRGFIYNFRKDYKKVDNTHEWCNAGNEPLQGGLQDLDVSPSSWCLNKLEKGESIIIDDVDGMPVLADPEKTLLEIYQTSALQMVPMQDADGKLTGFIGFHATGEAVEWSEQDLQILRVVSEMITSYQIRKKAEEDLKSSEIRFRSLIQNSSDLISVIDQKGNFLYQSPSIESILGFRADELINRNVFDFIHPQEKDSIKHKTLRSIHNKDNELLNLEFRIKHKKGSWRDLEAVGKNMLFDSRIEGIVINSRDVTLRKKAERDLIKAKNKAEEMNRLKTTFLANMSHEIRTPLTGILGYASIMQTDLQQEEDREMARRIHDSGIRLLATIDAILDLAKIEADKLDIKLRSVNLTDELQHSCELFAPLASQRNLSLECESEGELYAKLDPQFFSQIMNNLIGNALKYTHQGKVSVKTESTVLQENASGQKMAVIHVEDTGVGISDDFVDKIFDEFEQESVGLSRKFEGAGLGLTITKKLVEMMNGRIHVKSEKGKGSVFTVMFPVAGKKKNYEDKGDKLASRTPKPVKESGEKPKILLVEDNEDSQIVTRSYLNGNYDLDSVKSGEDALRFVHENRYDLILMDINLGDGMDGVEALNEIRKQEGHEATPVLAITAYAMKGDESYYRKQGFSDYVSKPFNREEIYGVIQRMLKQKAG